MDLSYGTVQISNLDQYNKVTNYGSQPLNGGPIAAGKAIVAVLRYLNSASLAYRIEKEIKALDIEKDLKANELDGMCYDSSKVQIGVLVAVIVGESNVGEVKARSFITCFKAAAGKTLPDAFARYKKETAQGEMYQ